MAWTLPENETIEQYLTKLNGRFVLDSHAGHIRYADSRPLVAPQMPLWLTRHGETHINLRRDAEGWANSGTDDELNMLTRKGRQQAQELARRLWSALQKEISTNAPIVVITSALLRAKHTAQPFLEMLKSRGLRPEVKTDPRFNEIDLGI